MNPNAMSPGMMCAIFVFALVAILVAWKFMIEGLIE
jgi:hypothetical protein